MTSWRYPARPLLQEGTAPLGQRDLFPLGVDDIADLPSQQAALSHPMLDAHMYVYHRWEFGFDDPAGSGWAETLTGLGSDVAQVTGEDNGVADFASGTSLDGNALWRWANSQTHVRANRNPVMRGRAAPITSGLSSKRHVGISNDWLTAVPAEFIGFRCVGDGAGVKNWEALTVTGGVATATDTGIAGTLNIWRNLFWEVQNKGRRVLFHIYNDDAIPKLLGTIVHTTNIPTGQLTAGIRCWNDNTGTNRVWRWDYIEFWYLRRAP